MNEWRRDPDLAGRFHPEYPDDLQVVVHDGEPRRTHRAPEACWVRVTGLHRRTSFPTTTRAADGPLTPDRVSWVERSVYRGTLLNQPNQLLTTRQGQPLLFVAVPGAPHPLQVGEPYLAERVRWAFVPCDRCGADQSMDPPSTMGRTRFPAVGDAVPIAFTAFCVCGGTMILMVLDAAAPAPRRRRPSPTTPLEQILGLVEIGASREEVRACWPRDTTWQEKANSLIPTTQAIAPFRSLEYVFAADKLYNIKLVAVVPGDYAALEHLQEQVLRQLPAITLQELGKPWSLENARTRLEGKGSDKFMAAVMVEGRAPGQGRLSGKAVAFKRGADQRYGFELFWYPLAGDSADEDPEGDRDLDGDRDLGGDRGGDREPGGLRAPTPAPIRPPRTRWVWIEVPEGGRALAFTYVDPAAGPSAKGAVVGDPPTEQEIRKAVDHPDRTFRGPADFGAAPVSPEQALRLGLPKDPPWIGIFEKKPIPPPRGQPSRVITGRVLFGGAPVAGARVRMGRVVGAARELLQLDERASDKDGRFQFPLAPMDEVVVVADGQAGSSRLTSVPDDGPVEIALARVGAVQGQVLRAGAPIAAQVSLVGLDGGMHRVGHSGADGRYRIAGVVPGRYELKVEALDDDRMTNGTAVLDEIAIAEGETAARDFAVAAGAVVRVAVRLEDERQDGHVYLVAGLIAPQRESELRALFASPALRSANRLAVKDRRLTTEFRDVVPGAYTVCVTPWDRTGRAPDQPVVSQQLMVGADSQTVELVLPRGHAAPP